MPSNVEIKASVSDIEELRKVASHLSGSSGTLIPQEDVFFNVPAGRLKLRKLQGCPAELIFYERNDESGPKFSNYNKTEVTNPDSIQETLGKALGVKGWVKKTRTLYMVGQTRVHVDQVDGLGNFMELEVVLKDGQTMDEGQIIAENLMKQLNIQSVDLISVAYMDLILQKNSQT